MGESEPVATALPLDQEKKLSVFLEGLLSVTV